MRLAITGLSLVLSPRRLPPASLDGTPVAEALLGPLRQIGAVMTAEAAEAAFGRKLARQCDTSTLLGMACLDRAIAVAGGGGVEPARLGVFCATTLGGVEFSEPQLALQVLQGPERVSAFQAIAWFYAATQGQWTIARGMRGYAKSFTADRAGAVGCILGAMLAIEAGHCDAALCAALDAPLSPFSMALQRAGRRLPVEPSTFVSEGAGAIFVEPVERARARGAHVFGEILEADARVVLQSPEAAVEASLAHVIEGSEAAGASVRRVLLEAGQPGWQCEIEAALASLGRHGTVFLDSPAGALGTLLSAGVMVDIALGCCVPHQSVRPVMDTALAGTAHVLAGVQAEEAEPAAITSASDCFVVASGTGTGVVAHVAVLGRG